MAIVETGQRIVVDTNRERLDLELIHEFLVGSYWARGMPREVLRRAIAQSLCFGVYVDNRQVGFARVVTDSATFGYLSDVFIIESHRGMGLSKVLMTAITRHSDLQGFRRWLLGTRDAHALYAQYGFTPLAAPARFMERHDPDVYAAPPDTGPAELEVPRPSSKPFT